MKSIVLSVLVMLLCACTTTRVQDRTLTPAIESAYPGVRADAELGGMPAGDLLLWDAGIEAGNLRGLDVGALESFALLGVDARLAAGEIGPLGAEIMRDRARSFRRAVEELLRPVLASAPVRTTPLVISRSSWATSPPSAIAGRTYR